MRPARASVAQSGQRRGLLILGSEVRILPGVRIPLLCNWQHGWPWTTKLGFESLERGMGVRCTSRFSDLGPEYQCLYDEGHRAWHRDQYENEWDYTWELPRSTWKVLLDLFYRRR